jgi:hypothetical protein
MFLFAIVGILAVFIVLAIVVRMLITIGNTGAALATSGHSIRVKLIMFAVWIAGGLAIAYWLHTVIG